MKTSCRRVAAAIMAVAGLASTAVQPAGATTKIGANTPLRWPHHLHPSGDFTLDGARGTNIRNNTCNDPAIACEDRTYLERHKWSGWAKQESSERHNSPHTNISCMGYETNQNWKTAHRARYIVQQGQSFGVTGPGGVGITVGSSGAAWTSWFGDWSDSSRFDTKC